MDFVLSQTEKHRLVQGELADLALYTTLRKRATGEFASILDEFIATETRHAAFWQTTFETNLQAPSWFGKIRNRLILVCVSIFGEAAGYLLLEAVESHGIKQYLDLWQRLPVSHPAREGIKQILTEELHHEDEAATGGERKVDPDTVRNAFLGFNDGSVEILGAVTGLVAALQDPNLIAIAAGTVSVAGAVSMGAGAFLSTHAERELHRLQAAKQQFLLTENQTEKAVSPIKAAVIVAVGYVIGAAVPVAPFFLGAHSPIWSIVLSGSLILLVSAVLSFLSGMDMRRRMILNAAIITLAVLISYAMGSWLDTLTI